MAETLPLFPLHTVLFPEGKLPLKVFEARYMDMISRCMRENTPFGVCLIAEGKEVGRPAMPHMIGCTARIVDWDMSQPGVLQVVTRGERRFRIREYDAAPDSLLVAKIEWLPDWPALPTPDELQDIVPLLKAIAADQGEAFPSPHRFDDASWVGARYAEVLPIQPLARQKLLELDDVVSRLEIIRKFLLQRELLKSAS